MDGTNRHDLSSYAWDTSMCHSALNRTQNGEISLGQEIYLLKLEKKLKRAQDQVAFDSQVDTQHILKPTRSLIQICLTKLKLLTKQIEEKIDLDKTPSETKDDDSFLKLTEQNKQLKKQIKVGKMLQRLFDEMAREDDQSLRKFDVLDNKIKGVIQDYVPKAKNIQLFLSKDDEG